MLQASTSPVGSHSTPTERFNSSQRRTFTALLDRPGRLQCCQAVSRQEQQTAVAVPVNQLDYPLVERMFDHNWRSPLAGHDHPDPACRPVLALGKFDALHKGHQALAAAALQLGGMPVLLSFSGMAAVLGWAPRKPLVAPCDRPRVLHLWAQQLAQQQLEQRQRQQQRRRKRAQTESQPSNTDAVQQQQQQQRSEEAVQVVPVRQRYIPFAAVRSLSPAVFVDHIRNDFKAAGVVSGINYRFGYRAAGDAGLLKQLCGAAGLPVSVVEMVGAATPGAVGPVSSTKIREMLDSCRLEAVKRSLGRPYRLVAEVNFADWQQQQQQLWGGGGSGGGNGISAALLHSGQVFIPNHSLLNQHPAPGVFLCDMQLFVGASAHNDLLQLEQPVDSSSSNIKSSSIQVLPVASKSRGFAWCVRATQQQVEVVPDGILVPRALWDAAESCLNNAADIGSTASSSARSSRGSSSSSNSSEGSMRGTDPLMWDTDDRESDEEEQQDGSGGVAAAGGDGDGSAYSALLVLDIEVCLMQMCTFP